MNPNFYPPPMNSSEGMMPPMNMNHPHMPPPHMGGPMHQMPMHQMPMQQMPMQINGPGMFSELDGIDQVDIIQEASCIDFLCPRLTSNTYKVNFSSSEKTLYEFYEESGCCEKWCCYKCHSFKMKINNMVSERNNVSVTMEGNKNFVAGIILNCCGCGKPSIPIEVKSPQGMMLGKVIMEWNSSCCACCSSRIEIKDNIGNTRYVIKGNCCCPVGCYYDNACTKICGISYTISQNNVEVGNIRKKCCDSCRTFCTKATDYNISFPPQASPEEKFLIIVGAILLDYQSYYL